MNSFGLGLLIVLGIGILIGGIAYTSIQSDKLNYQFQTDCVKAGGSITVGPSYNKICTNNK